MSEFKSFHEIGFDESAEVFGLENVLIGGVPFACVVSLDVVTPSLEFGGERLVQWLHLEVSKSAMLAEPAANTVVSYQSRAFAVRRVTGAEASDCSWLIDAMRTVRPSES